MMNRRSLVSSLAIVAGAALFLGCSSSVPERVPVATGGSTGTGGTDATGGATNIGGSATGGAGGGGATGGGGSSSAGGSNGVGGSGNDSGVTPGSDASATPEGGIGPCAASGLIVCDEFETTTGNTPDPTKWMPYTIPDPTIPVIDATKAHNGTHSVRTTGTSTGLGSFLVPTMGLPTADDRVYVRAWVHFDKDTSVMTGHDAFIIGASSRDQSGTELRLGISSSSNSPPMLDLNLQNPKDGPGEVTRFSNGSTTGGDLSAAPGFSFVAGTPDRWYCVETLFSGTGGVGEFDVWIDGTEVPNMHVTDFKARPTDTSRTMWAPMFSFIKIGAQNYSGDIGKIWYDDVAVGTQRIGCN
jgi:hypothetical protein